MDGDESDRRRSSILDPTVSSLNQLNDPTNNGDEPAGSAVFDEQQILDETTREYIKYGFKKIAKSSDFIRIEDIGDAFRHAGQNPAEDIVKDMMEKARALKAATQTDREEDPTFDQINYPDYLSIVHEYWYPIDEDRQHLEEAFDILDPKRTAKLGIDEFQNLLRNCDWAEDEIDLLMAQVSCGDGYFLYDDLIKLLLTPVELPKKKSAKPKSSSAKKKKN